MPCLMKSIIICFFVLMGSIACWSQTKELYSLEYEINKLYPPCSVTQEELKAAVDVLDINPKFPVSWVKECLSMSVSTTVNGDVFFKNKVLHKEVFGPYSMVVQCKDAYELASIIANLEGQLTGTIISDNEAADYDEIIEALKSRVGRIIFNGVPTGVEVCPSMLHGGPYPASTDSRFTAVGVHSIKRWVRPFSYQDWPNELLPDALKNENPLNISRVLNGVPSNQKIES